MAIVTLQTAAEIEAQKSQTPSVGQAKDPLAGMNVLTAEGQEPGQKGIQITEKALKRIRVAMAKEGVSPEQGGLRVGIQGGGCSGLSYNIRFDTQPRERDRVYSFGRGLATVGDPTNGAPMAGRSTTAATRSAAIRSRRQRTPDESAE